MINSNAQLNFSVEEVINNGAYIHITTDYVDKYLKINSIPNQVLKRKDVQLFKIAEPIDFKLPSVKIADKKDITFSGLDIGFIGYTKDDFKIKKFEKFVSKGILSNIKLNIEGQTEPSYTINAFSTFGYSGGPVYLSKNGKVIGLISSGTNDPTGKTGIVFVPAIQDIPKIINRLENG